MQNLPHHLLASDDVPYRDIKVYINHVLQGSQNSTNITLGVGDNVTIVVRAVGNISVINASNQDERFVCRTHFACNTETRKNIHNRHLLCSLQSAMLSDDGRTLVVILDGVEWNRFIIICECAMDVGVVNFVTCVCACACVCVHTHACVHACVCICVHFLCVFVCVCVCCVSVCMNLCMCLCKCMLM